MLVDLVVILHLTVLQVSEQVARQYMNVSKYASRGDVDVRCR
jgi:hypothetical protein